MTRLKTETDRRLPDLDDVHPHPLFAQLRPERRNVVTRKALLHRVRSEFREMCGLSLTLAQTARLFGVPQGVCARILPGLADEGLLRLTVDGRYAVRGENP